MTRLSVNINKVALIRNSRGGNLPDLRQFAIDCESYGAQGITVHPRPDERHIRYADVPLLKSVVTTEFNIEGYPSERFVEMVIDSNPHQVTLVPDPPGVLTSSEGWNVQDHVSLLQDVVGRFKEAGIRVSIFMDPDPEKIKHVPETGADRIELYTGDYAYNYASDREIAIAPHMRCDELVRSLGLGLNAGHDLNLKNLHFYSSRIWGLLEVSIGHALISDALYYGIRNTILMYRNQLSMV